MAINNGTQPSVVFGEYAGRAGRVDRAGHPTQIAFVGDWRLFRKVDRGTIDGEPFEVISAVASIHNPQMVLLAVRPA